MPSLSRPPAVNEQPGLKKLGRYECTEQVGGDGGFETYRARVRGLTGLDRSFAVKVLRLKRSEIPSAVSEPFLHAAKRSAAVANPRIATVVEADAGEGLVFAATPFMEGLDLGRFLGAARDAGLLATGKDDKARQWYSVVAYIGAEVARGLHAAHSQNPPLVHGALCPGNVFITSRGAIRLLDFGLRAAVRRPFEPRPRRLLPYIAPELVAPAAEGTVAGDMYSLGVLLCELGSGGLPPQGRRSSEMQIALSLLPEDLGLLIGRLISVSPTARPAANDAVAALAAAHREMSETDLVGTLASLVQHFANDRTSPQEAPEAVVSLGGSADSPVDAVAEGTTSVELDEAPPPPSDVEHDEAYGLEASQVTRVPEPPRAPPAAPVPDFSRPPPGARDELYASSEPTTVGEPALIDDLVAKSRPSTARAGLAEARANPPLVPTLRAGSPILARAPAASVPTRGEPRRGTLRSFAPSASTPADAPPENRTDISGEWKERPPSKSRPRLTPTSASATISLGAAPPPLPGETEPTQVSPMESAEEIMLPSEAAFDAPPATWGARALAALGGQAGIEPAPGSSPGDLGLLDEVQLAPDGPVPPAGSPPLNAGGGGLDGRLRSPQILALDEPPIARHRAGALPSEPGSDLAMPAHADRGAADLQDRAEAKIPRDDSLLEDDLVDAPEAGRPASSWAEPSGTFALASQSAAAPPAQESDPYPQQPARAIADVLASADGAMRPARGNEALSDDGGQGATVPAYFDDNGQPLPESEIAAPLEASAAQAPARAPAPARSSGGQTRPASLPGAVPAWVKSPDTRSSRPPRRRLIWGIVGSVLGASIVLGGLAGFFVGSRGKPWSAMLGVGRPPALSKPNAARSKTPVEEDATAPTPGHSAGPVPPKAAAGEAAGPAPRAAKTAPAAKLPGLEKAPATKSAGAPPASLARAVQAAHKQTSGTAVAAPGSWGQGVSDSGAGLVSVSVSTQPAGAAVWINGKERGRSPLQIKIQAGPARVVMVLAGHASATADVTASEGAKISRDLAAIDPPMTGEARFRAECTTLGKLPIVVDGKETGVLCPFSKLRVDPGVHKIGLFVPSLGKVHEKEVTLHPGVRSIVFAD